MKSLTKDPFWRRIHTGLIVCLLVAAVLRVYAASPSIKPQGGIEVDEFIRCAESISWQHLPIRDYQHPALPAYLIRASAELFGRSVLGYRFLGILAGLGLIALLYSIALRWWGYREAVLAALLLSVNRYLVASSAWAGDLSFDLFFVAAAMWAFSRFLWATQVADRSGKGSNVVQTAFEVWPARWFYMAALFTGLGFLCKEITSLLIPVFFLTVLAGKTTRKWLLRREPYIAALVFFIVISPDIFRNILTPVETQDAYVYMNYADHLSRFAGIGFNEQPWLFYFGQGVEWLKIRIENGFSEMPFQHLVMGIALWFAVLFATFSRRKDALTVFLLIMFWSIFLFFALIKTDMPTTRQNIATDPKMWYWVDRTMLAATLLLAKEIMCWVKKIFLNREFALHLKEHP
jgi:4-amino-4-deoxy-L-arabinose transferase-like glycosyltransferase